LVIVLVTETEFRRAPEVFESAAAQCIATAADEDTLATAVAQHGARYVIVGSVKYEGRLYDALPRGGVIARFGVGHDGIDKQKATAAGVFCTNTPGVLDESVAELAILLMLAGARRLAALTSEMRSGEWALGPAGIELRGKTLAVIGGGRIGQATARIASLGFGMRTIACRRTPGTGVTTPFAMVTDDFRAAVADADFVSLHINAEPANHHFIDSNRLAFMPPRAWLINTARGSVVDEIALYDALTSDRLAGAALDVFDREPYVPADATHDLRALSNVVMVPHVGSHTREANRGMAERALQNIMLAEAGDYRRMDVVNRQVLTLPGFGIRDAGSDAGADPHE
jgi:lactate dehydrogenase-like 2-hydroxyacid dehydrogenase